MASQRLDNILKQLRELNEREYLELRRLLNQKGTEPALPDALAPKRGVACTVPPPPTADTIARFKSWRPIHMPGGSLSDELIRDRR